MGWDHANFLNHSTNGIARFLTDTSGCLGGHKKPRHLPEIAVGCMDVVEGGGLAAGAGVIRSRLRREAGGFRI